MTHSSLHYLSTSYTLTLTVNIQIYVEIKEYLILLPTAPLKMLLLPQIFTEGYTWDYDAQNINVDDRERE